MGQQQLLLLVLAVVIVGVAVFAGVEAFGRNIEKETYNQMASEAVKLAGEAFVWRQKPGPMGGTNPWYMEGLTFGELGYPTTGSDPRNSTTETFQRFIRQENTIVPVIEVRSVEHDDLRVQLHIHGESAACMVLNQQQSVNGEWLDTEVPPRPSGCTGWPSLGPRGPGGVIVVPGEPLLP